MHLSMEAVSRGQSVVGGVGGFLGGRGLCWNVWSW